MNISRHSLGIASDGLDESSRSIALNINDLTNETPVVPLNNPPQISLGEGDPYVMSIDEDDDGLTPIETQFGYFVFDFNAIDFDDGQLRHLNGL